MTQEKLVGIHILIMENSTYGAFPTTQSGVEESQSY